MFCDNAICLSISSYVPIDNILIVESLLGLGVVPPSDIVSSVNQSSSLSSTLDLGDCGGLLLEAV